MHVCSIWDPGASDGARAVRDFLHFRILVCCVPAVAGVPIRLALAKRRETEIWCVPCARVQIVIGKTKVYLSFSRKI